MTFLCKTCGTQFPESDAPPRECPICEDERQYVPAEGQQWVAYDDVRSSHRAEIRDEQPQLTGIGMEPSFGISQRALLVESQGGNVLWDCLPLLSLAFLVANADLLWREVRRSLRRSDAQNAAQRPSRSSE